MDEYVETFEMTVSERVSGTFGEIRLVRFLAGATALALQHNVVNPRSGLLVGTVTEGFRTTDGLPNLPL